MGNYNYYIYFSTYATYPSSLLCTQHFGRCTLFHVYVFVLDKSLEISNQTLFFFYFLREYFIVVYTYIVSVINVVRIDDVLSVVRDNLKYDFSLDKPMKMLSFYV